LHSLSCARRRSEQQKSKHVIRGRNIVFQIEKKDAQWWERLTKEPGKVAWLTVDWNRWKDEDDSDDEEQLDGAMPFDLSQFGATNPLGGQGDDDDDDGENGRSSLENANKQKCLILRKTRIPRQPRLTLAVQRLRKSIKRALAREIFCSKNRFELILF
jgi:hypothetical protein